MADIIPSEILLIAEEEGLAEIDPSIERDLGTHIWSHENGKPVAVDLDQRDDKVYALLLDNDKNIIKSAFRNGSSE